MSLIKLQLGPVILLDRDVSARTFGAEVLVQANLDVLEACSADEALCLLECRTLIAALVTDVDIPGCFNGADLAGFVARRWPRVHLVITSAQGRPRALPQRAGFVAKPYRAATLVQEVAGRIIKSFG